MAAAMRAAVLGAGWGARVSVPAFRAAGWDVAGFWSRTPERAKEHAERLKIPFATTEAAELFAAPGIDAVAIHTPPALHLPLCRAALDAGKHVLCDKPFAMSVAEAEEIAALAEASGPIAMINYEFRFAPLPLQIKDLLDQGAIGRFHHAAVETHVTNPLIGLGIAWRLDPRQGGGILNELGSHYVDRLRQWFGDISSLSARLASFPPPDAPALATEDWLGATCSFRNGGHATLNLSWVAELPLGSSVSIAGSEGVLTARCADSMLCSGEITLGRRGEPEVEVVPPPPGQLEFQPENAPIAASSRLIAAFADGIETGVSPHPNFSDGLQSQIAIDAMRESAATGRVVQLTG